MVYNNIIEITSDIRNVTFYNTGSTVLSVIVLLGFNGCENIKFRSGKAPVEDWSDSSHCYDGQTEKRGAGWGND